MPFCSPARWGTIRIDSVLLRQVGEYVEGLREGYGVYVFPNGDRYEGECLGDLPEGHGVYRFQVSGAVCEGTWRAGAKHGFFIVTVGCKHSCGTACTAPVRFAVLQLWTQDRTLTASFQCR